MTEKLCTDCKHSRPYDEFIAEPRMCDADPQGMHWCNFARQKYGFCGLDGKLFEPVRGQRHD